MLVDGVRFFEIIRDFNDSDPLIYAGIFGRRGERGPGIRGRADQRGLHRNVVAPVAVGG